MAMDADNAARDRAIDQDRGVPPNLLYAGVIVGLLLIFVGIGLLFFGRGSLLSSLMTCVGFGVVLASFGARAGGSWAGWTVTGAGALAIALFLLLQHYQPSPPFYKKGQLRGDFSKIADLRIIDDQPMYQYRDRTTQSIKFVLLDTTFHSTRLSIQVDTTETGPGREFFELFGDANAIHSRYLSETGESDRQIQWTFDYNRRVVSDGPDIIFKEQDTLQEHLIPTSRTGFLRWRPAIDMQIATAAFAENAPNAQSSTAVADLVSRLKSDDTSIRRNARNDLAALGPSAVGPMMSALRANSSDYRIRLGILYGLSEILRRHPDQRSAISSALTDEDFPVLVAGASDDDKTIRIQAAEFLYLLQDPRAVPASVEAARDTPDPNKATNQLYIVRQSGQSLDAPQKRKILDDLTSGPGGNNDLVRNVGSVAKTLGW